MAEQAVARVGDTGTGVCSTHGAVTVTFTSGSPNVNADTISIVRVGDVGIASCGATTIATTGGNTKIDELAVHRVGDTGTISHGGSYTVATGSPNVFAD